MTSVASLWAFAHLASVPPLVLVDMQQEYLAEPRLPALSGADAVLVNCRKVLDHARTGLPAALMRIIDASFFNRITASIRRVDGLEPYRNEMIFERGNPSCYSFGPFAAFMDQSGGGIVMAEFAGGRTSFIAQFRRYLMSILMCVIRPSESPQPRLGLGNGKQANGMSAGG